MARSIEALCADFQRDGFVNGGPVASAEQLADVHADLEHYADVQFRGATPTKPMPKFDELGHDADTKHYQITLAALVSDAFRRLVSNERALELAAALIGAKTLHLWADTVQYKPALTGGPVNWHQDGYYHLGVSGIKEYERVLSAWIALDDADEESGCMWMAPGSHRWGLRQHHLNKFTHLRERENLGNLEPLKQKEFKAEWRGAQPCEVKAGEIHFHHAVTWHGSPINRSPRQRRGYTLFLIADGVDQSHLGAEERILLYDRA